MSTTYNENVTLRARAKELVSYHWGKMLLMGVIIFLVIMAASLILGAISTLLLGESIDSMAQSLTYSSKYGYSTSARASGTMGLATVISVLSSLIITLLSSGLTLGYNATMISAANGEEIRSSGVFCRMRYCLKGLGLNLWMGLKIFLWMLPGLGVMIAGGLIGSVMDSPEAMMLCMFVGYVLMFILLIRATYSYAMSTYRLADEPDLGVFDAVNYSKGVMNGRRWQLFKLTIPYALILIAVMIALVVVLSLVAEAGEGFAAILGIVGFIAYLVLAVVFSLRIAMAQTCFYIAHK